MSPRYSGNPTPSSDARTAPDKTSLITQLCDRVRSDVDTVRKSQLATQAGATHTESQAENSKDTRATESSYLARGLASRVEELEADLAKLVALTPSPVTPDEPISIGALVCLEDENGDESNYLLVPARGGETLEHAGCAVRTLTASSPLGQQLIGRSEDDEIVASLPRGPFRATITRVR